MGVLFPALASVVRLVDLDRPGSVVVVLLGPEVDATAPSARAGN